LQEQNRVRQMRPQRRLIKWLSSFEDILNLVYKCQTVKRRLQQPPLLRRTADRRKTQELNHGVLQLKLLRVSRRNEDFRTKNSVSSVSSVVKNSSSSPLKCQSLKNPDGTDVADEILDAGAALTAITETLIPRTKIIAL